MPSLGDNLHTGMERVPSHTRTMKTRHEKLVRDRIPEILAEPGIPHETRVADRPELEGLLLAKLEEETAEYLAATGDRARTEELADILEVVLGLGSLCGADRDSLERVRALQAAARGTFNAQMVLISTGVDEQDLNPIA